MFVVKPMYTKKDLKELLQRVPKKASLIKDFEKYLTTYLFL